MRMEKTVSITNSTVATLADSSDGQSIASVGGSEAIDSVSATDLSFIVNSSAVTPGSVSGFIGQENLYDVLSADYVQKGSSKLAIPTVVELMISRIWMEPMRLWSQRCIHTNAHG